MTAATEPEPKTGAASSAAWPSVFALSLCAATLVASEFMPISVLTPIANDLGITEGQTGQAISISGLAAVATSLFIARLTGRFDRRHVVLALTGLLILAGVTVAFAPDYPVLIAGRIMVGIGIGGFWSMIIALVMRLVPVGEVPQGLALINAGNAVAATLSAPLGSLLGDVIGWRGAIFLFLVPLALAAFVWQWISLPSLPPRPSRTGNVLALLLRPQVALGMGAILLLFGGQRALFTYLRPYLIEVQRVDVPTFSLVLLLMGLAGVLGAMVIARVLRTRYYAILIGIPLAMTVLTLPLAVVNTLPIAAAALVIVWTALFTAAPVAWGTWLSRAIADDPELGGGLQVATIQLGATLGAAASGVLVDNVGLWSSVLLTAAMLLGSSLLAMAAAHNARAVRA